MNATDVIVVDTSKVEKLLGGSPRVLKRWLTRGLSDAGKGIVTKYHKERVGGPFGENILSKKTGSGGHPTFWQMFFTKINAPGDSLNIGLETKSRLSLNGAMKVHEEGGTISAKRGAILAPIYNRKFMFDRYHRVKEQFKNPQQHPNVVPIFSRKTGKTYLVSFQDKAHTLRSKDILFVMKSQISFQNSPRLGFQAFKKSQAVKQLVQSKIDDAGLRAVKEIQAGAS